MTPKLTCKTDVAAHSPPVIPGNAGDPLSMPLAETLAAFSDILTCTQSQDDKRVDTRLTTGMTNRGSLAETWMNPMRPLFIHFDLPAPPAQPPQGYPVTGGWAGGVGRLSHLI